MPDDNKMMTIDDGKNDYVIMRADEVAEDRQQYIESHGELNGDPGPGSLYCHEALHMASFLAGAIDNELCGHPAIFSNPKWFSLAMIAQQSLATLYQEIGGIHLDSKDPNAKVD